MPEIVFIRVGFDDKPAAPKINTPWGTADHVEELADGIIQVGTPTHGGIGVKHEVAAKRLSAAARTEAIDQYDHLWFEEDCDWAIVCHEIPELFSKQHREMAARSLARWNQRYLERRLAGPGKTTVGRELSNG